ncbi:hypothetical protein Tco_1477952, partial [Tanacetum coccineum]
KEMDLETSQTNVVAKLPLLKQGEYEMWRLNIEEYFQIQDYALWDIIEPVTTKEKTQKQNDVKAKKSLDSIFNMLQKIISQLAILDLDSMSFDDLYNNFKIVEQEVKRTVTSSSNSGSQNMAFVSTPSSTNEVNTANVQVSTANSSVSTTSTHDNTANLSDATVYVLETKKSRSLVVI